MPNNKYYPLALIAIIGGALYFLSGYFFSSSSVDMSAYQKVCDQYLAAAPGTVKDKAIQSYTAKVDYLLPKSVNELTDPLEKSVKTCSEKLKQRLANKAGK